MLIAGSILALNSHKDISTGIFGNIILLFALQLHLRTCVQNKQPQVVTQCLILMVLNYSSKRIYDHKIYDSERANKIFNIYLDNVWHIVLCNRVCICIRVNISLWASIIPTSFAKTVKIMRNPTNRLVKLLGLSKCVRLTGIMYVDQ